MKPRQKSETVAARKRVLIVDDHPMTRYGIAQLIAQEPDLQVCGEADGAEAALAVVKKLAPNVVLADLTMPKKSGLEFIKDMKAQHPSVPVLVVSMHEESVYAERALRVGAAGLLMKSAGGERLLQAVRAVLEGRKYVSDELSTRIVDLVANRHRDASGSMLGTLSEREFNIFEQLGQGLTTSEIARLLKISDKTVATHRMNAVKKLKLTNAAELAKFAIRWARAQEMA